MKVTVEPLHYKSFTVDIEPSDDGDTVKRKVEAITGVAPMSQRLYFCGHQLGCLEKTMGEYGMTEGSKIQMICGVGPPPRIP